MTLKLAALAFGTLLPSFTRVFSAIRVSAQNGRPIFAAAAGVCVLLLLGGSVPAHAQSVSFGGVQTTVPASELNHPYGVAVDGAGDVFIADTGNSRVVEVPAGGGTQITVPASGLSSPYGVAVDGAGDVFIADTGNSRVVEVPAGGGAQITVPASGLSLPTGVAVDGAGDVFIADFGNSQVVEVSASGGAQTTVVGSALGQPWGVAVDGAGDVFIAYPSVYQNTPKVVEVPVGGGPQTTVGGRLYSPYNVAADVSGDVFIADYGSNQVVEVPAGGGTETTVGTRLNPPFGVAVDGTGDFFIAYVNNGQVVEVQPGAVNFGNVNVCPTGQTTPAPCTQTLTLNYDTAPTTTFGATIKVVTQGMPNLDFTLSSGSTCTGTVNANTTCTVNVTFAPLAPGARMGAVQLFDNLGNLLVTTMVHGVGQGPAVGFGPGAQTSVGSELSYPTEVAVDGAGDVFIADHNNNRVVEVQAGGGPQTTVGSGLSSPHGVAVDGAGDVFIADAGNNRVVEAPAGGGPQTTVGSGLNSPYGVTVDGAGDVFIADTYNSRVVEVPAGGGPQTTVGNGLSYPFDVAVDGAGDVFIADSGNNRVVEVPSGGGAQTTVPASGLYSPSGVVVDGAGDLFIADTNNGRVVEAPAGGGAQTTVGSGLDYPYGVAVDGAGDVFVADAGNNRVVVVQRAQPPTLSFASTAVGSTSSDSPQSVTIQNIGNQPLDAATPGLVVSGPNFLQVAGSGTPADCTSSFALTPGASCNLSISFEPQSVGNLTATAIFTDNALNATAASQSVALQGTGTQESQTITFGALSNQAFGTAPFTISATASSGLAVSFTSTTPAVCTVSGATVTLVAVGVCNIQATQAGNTNYAAATPVYQRFLVTPESQTITFGALSNQAFGTAPFTISATASSGLAVSFASTTPAVCTVSGATVTLVAAGTCTVQATQAGNANYAAATPVNQSFQVTDFTLASNPTSTTITAGQPATFTLTATPQGSFTSPISFSCTGLPALANCTFSPTTVTPGTSTLTTKLTIGTTPHTTALAPPPFGRRSGPRYAMWLVLPALLLGTVGMATPKRRKLLSYCLVFLLVSGCVLQVACSNGGNSGGTGGTPAGNYTITITGAAASTQHTATVTLTVQ